MTKYTPGQWMAVGMWVEHVDDNRPDICSCNPSDFEQQGRSVEEACANARLLAQAPALLKSLKALLKMPEYDGTQATSALRRQVKRDARAAIAQATGAKP